MRTTIGTDLTVEKDSFTGLSQVSSTNPLIPDFPYLWTDSTLAKYKHKYGLLKGMREICRLHITMNWHYDLLPTDEQEKLVKAYRTLNKALRIIKKLNG